MRPAARGLDCSTRNSSPFDRALDVHAREHRRDHFHVLCPRAVDVDLSTRHGGHHRPASRLDVVAPQFVFGATQLAAAFDPNGRRARAGDAGAELLEERAQLDDMRLAGSVADLADPGRRRCGQERRFSAGDRGFVEVDRRRLQAVGRLQHMSGAFRPARAHRFERLEVRVDRAARRKITSRRRQVRPAAPREQRAQEQHRTPQAADQRAIRLVLDDVGTAHAQRRAADPFDFTTEIENQPRHHLDVADPRNVGEHAFFACQQTGGQKRKRRVLVALDFNSAGQPAAAFNQ